MKIGSVLLSNNVFLAPMAGITDLAFRQLCKREGCGLTYSEMISAKGMHYKNENTQELLARSDEEKPAAVQIFGSDPELMAEAASEAEKKGADIIDINMGCPTPKIVKNGDGCALMQNPELAAEIVRQISAAVKAPVTVKIRKGWDNASINAVEFALMVEAAGAKAVTVHGRTREQFYSGKADWDIIAKVKKELEIPVIGNGDIFTVQDAEKMLDVTGCDAIMIGRGAQGNPWIFNRVLTYLNQGIILSEPTAEEKIRMALDHMTMVIAQKGEIIGVKEMRKHIAWYLKGLHDSAVIRAEVNTLSEADKVEALLNTYLEKLAQSKPE